MEFMDFLWTMNESKTYDDLLDEMYGHRESLIKALHFYNGETNIQNIRKRGEIPKGSIYNLVNRMVEWDVIKKVGEEEIGQGGTSDVYQFTDLGHAICEAVVGNNSETIDDVQDLSEKVETNREAMEEHGETLDELREDFEEMKQFVEEVESYFEDQENTTQS